MMKHTMLMGNILAVDVGKGTQDIMVTGYNENRGMGVGLESAYKLVLPAPTAMFAAEVRESREDLVIYGDTMGGGPFSRAVLEHRQKYKYRVYMTERAARTIRDDLKEVKSYGIEIISENEVGSMREKKIRIYDFDRRIINFLASFGIDTDFDTIAIAVQDHGVAPMGISDRENRFRLIKEKLRDGEGIEAFAYVDGVPENLSRMRAMFESLRRWYEGRILLMDTGPAAVLGALEDERVKGAKSVMCVNVGNAHTIAMLLNEKRIQGVFEHHTRLVDKQKLGYFMKRLANGEITFEEVFADGGHGALSIGETKPEVISITGPKREKMRGLGIFSAPAGDMMMTGAVGLIKAANAKCRVQTRKNKSLTQINTDDKNQHG
jgi:uncharacterized protein (DUF1786 family)